MKLLAAGAVAGLLIGALGMIGTYALIQRSQPRALTLAAGAATSPAPAASPDSALTQACRRPAVPPSANSGLAGLWEVQPGSIAGYRATEKFAELPSPHVAVARTQKVSGWVLAGDEAGVRTVETACVAVDLASLHSVDQLPGFNTTDRDRSSNEFLGVHSYPFAIFQPYPMRVTGVAEHVRLVGVLELHGIRKPVTFDVDFRLSPSQVAVAGQTTVAVRDYGVEVPQEAGGFVQVEPNITLEISLVLARG
ncbi:MAG TPA: YceI family protein [Candidatus Dormibacteraeota bacterium]